MHTPARHHFGTSYDTCLAQLQNGLLRAHLQSTLPPFGLYEQVFWFWLRRKNRKHLFPLSERGGPRGQPVWSAREL